MADATRFKALVSGVRRRLSYANVTATAALVVALGGTSYAVTTLPANSVGPRQLNFDVGVATAHQSVGKTARFAALACPASRSCLAPQQHTLQVRTVQLRHASTVLLIGSAVIWAGHPTRADLAVSVPNGNSGGSDERSLGPDNSATPATFTATRAVHLSPGRTRVSLTVSGYALGTESTALYAADSQLTVVVLPPLS
jgi:hypothetical protein